MFTVVITEKGGAQRRVECDESEVTIGRVQGNDVVLPKGNVSKRHSRIVLRDNRFIVVDLKSTNGTYVNGRKITSPLVVKEGDKIYIGDFILTLEGHDAVRPRLSSEAPELGPSASALPPVLGDASAGQQPDLSQSAPPALPSRPPSLPAAGGVPADGNARKRKSTQMDMGPPDMGSQDDASGHEPEGPQVSGGARDGTFASASIDGFDGAKVATGIEVLDALLRDARVTRIEVTRYDRIFVSRGGGVKREPRLSLGRAAALEQALRQMAAEAAVPVGDTGSASFELDDGTHVSALWPPLASAGPAAVFSRRPGTVESLAELQNAGMLDGSQAQALRKALTERQNVLVVGPQRGITTVANALLAQLEADAHVVVVENGAEIGPRARLRVVLRWPDRGLNALLPHAGQFDVDRWLLHAAPFQEAVPLLSLMTARSDGSICTLQAPSLRDALDNLRAHAASLGDRAEGMLASAFPVVVELDQNATGGRVHTVKRLKVEDGRASAA